MIIKEGQIFNLMDTNGRRNDVINALQGYLSILDDVQNSKRMKWAAMPESLAQYEFYKQAIETSPDVFSQHEPFDVLQAEIQKNQPFANAVANQDLDWIRENANEYSAMIKQFDLGTEDRARHYTSTLVKLGFTDESREISPVGSLLLNLAKIKKDELEKTLPIDGVNVAYLRQLLKLRIFDETKQRFYSPFVLALFALLKRHRLSENEFSELVQGLSPYSNFDDVENYVLNYQEGAIVLGKSIEIPQEINVPYVLDKQTFGKSFKNRKSATAVNVYWNYYVLLYECVQNTDSNSIDRLLSFYEANRSMLNKAFGLGQNLFAQKNGDRPDPEKFTKQYQKLFKTNLNSYLYRQFALSKLLDQIREYSDTTKRVFKATGIISFDNGFVELAYRELCACIFDVETVKKRIGGLISEDSRAQCDHYDKYEVGINSYYCKVTSLSEILEIGRNETENVKDQIKKEFPGVAVNDVPAIVAKRRKQEFADFIEKEFPADKVKRLLSLFSDRSKDKEIKAIVCKDATVPTIFEYVVGIAWYYFSGKQIDLLGSFNLTLSANFEPLVHAGGGQGDIVIREEDKVVMLEATLMNASSQKRGEWEPVLRHSINLKIDEETAKTGREVTTFFIADSFDYNTINIWKAVAAVPLQSSIDKSKFTDNVVIMPVNAEELSALMDKAAQYDEILAKVRKQFEVDKISFDVNWREKIMSEIV